MSIFMTYVEDGGKVRTTPIMGDASLAETAQQWHTYVQVGDAIEWFFVSDREGDPILVSFQDWGIDPVWEVVYNDL